MLHRASPHGPAVCSLPQRHYCCVIKHCFRCKPTKVPPCFRVDHIVQTPRKRHVSQAHRSPPSTSQSSPTWRSAESIQFIPVAWKAHDTLILWDVENIKPFPPVTSTPVQLQRIKALLPGTAACSAIAALNQRSLTKARASGLLPILKASGVEVLPVSNFSDAADQALIAAGYLAVQATPAGPYTSPTHTSASSHPDGQQQQAQCSWEQEDGSTNVRLPLVMVVISQDARFAQLLSYATDRCAFTVVVAPFQQGLRAAAAAVATPLMRVQGHPLALAACASVIWEALPHSHLTPKDHILLEHTQQQARALHDADACGLEVPGAQPPVHSCQSNAQSEDEQGPGLVKSQRKKYPAALTKSPTLLRSCPGCVTAIWLNASRTQ